MKLVGLSPSILYFHLLSKKYSEDHASKKSQFPRGSTGVSKVVLASLALDVWLQSLLLDTKRPMLSGLK